MSILNLVMLALPVVFLVASVVVAVKAYEKGHNRKKTVLMQIASFAAVFAICLLCPIVAGAADANTVSEAVQVAQQSSKSFAYIGAAIAVGLSWQQVKIQRHLVKQSSSLLSVKVLPFTVCLSQS